MHDFIYNKIKINFKKSILIIEWIFYFFDNVMLASLRFEMGGGEHEYDYSNNSFDNVGSGYNLCGGYICNVYYV